MLPAFFDVTITNTNSPVQEGDILTVDYSADNTGDAQDTQDIRLEIDSVEEDRDSDITLLGAQSTTGTLEWDTTDEDETTYTATVLSDDDTDSVTVEIEDAIPDSAIAHYPILERSNSTIEDVLGDLDGSAQGTTNVSGNWEEGWAEDGDGGSDHILFNEWDAVFNNLRNGGGVYFTLVADNDDGSPLNSQNSGGGLFWGRTSGGFGSDAGQLLFFIQDGDGNDNRIYTDSSRFDDGGPWRICLTWSGSDATDMQIWVNGSEEDVTISNNAGWTADVSLNQPVTGLARNDAGSISENVDGTMDNVIPCDDAQEPSAISDDYDRQPWS